MRGKVDRGLFPAVGRGKSAFEEQLAGLRVGALGRDANGEGQRCVLYGSQVQVEPSVLLQVHVKDDGFGSAGNQRFAIDLAESLPADAGRNTAEMFLARNQAHGFNFEVGARHVGRADEQLVESR